VELGERARMLTLELLEDLASLACGFHASSVLDLSAPCRSIPSTPSCVPGARR
jgi:hypothetical protein